MLQPNLAADAKQCAEQMVHKLLSLLFSSFGQACKPRMHLSTMNPKRSHHKSENGVESKLSTFVASFTPCCHVRALNMSSPERAREGRFFWREIDPSEGEEQSCALHRSHGLEGFFSRLSCEKSRRKAGGW